MAWPSPVFLPAHGVSQRACMLIDTYPLGGILACMKHMSGTNKGRIIRRLKIIEGQIRGLQEMVEKGTYCIDVITQTSAVKQGLSNVEDALLENHLSGCVLDQVRLGQAAKAKEEILKVYKLKRK